jgi:hypothetical protein
MDYGLVPASDGGAKTGDFLPDLTWRGSDDAFEAFRFEAPGFGSCFVG